MSSTTVVWFRQDLRLEDNPALAAASARGAVVPVYIWDPAAEGDWAPGAAARCWLHRSLEDLGARLRSLGSRLVLARGDSLGCLQRLLADSGADAVFWNRRYEPRAVERDGLIKAALRRQGCSVRSFQGALLFEQAELRNRQGKPFQVFTPFWKHCLTLDPPAEPMPAPARLEAPVRWPDGPGLAELQLQPRLDWSAGIHAAWTMGEGGAQQSLERFLAQGIAGYRERRDFPGQPGVSRLSPHLHFGEISPSAVWHRVREHGAGQEAAEPYLRQLGWREFAHHLLYHFPHTPDHPLRREYRLFPWKADAKALTAWQRGRTGYPIVDAGMRELWHTGWMHNRVRMICASFLVKDLLIPWQEGARWFWDTLVDADLANNTLGWQWTAGCGADAAPYFRIFNPVTQARRFDPDGAYLRRWVPELAALPDAHLHEPWTAPAAVLAEAGVQLGKTYPRPLVDHAQARDRALGALAAMKGG